MTKHRSILGVVIALGLLGSLVGCAGRNDPRASMRFSGVVAVPPQQVIERTVSKKKLLSTALLGDTVNTLRIVPIFRRGEEVSGGPEVPTYRLFDIQSGSTYAMIGLENADVLLAADDYLVMNPDGFKVYVASFLPQQKSGSVVVRRNGVTTELKITVAD